MTGTPWSEFSPADFDRDRAPRGTAAKRAATADQPGLFFVPTPVTRPAKSGRVTPELDGQGDLFGDDDAATS